MSKTALFPAPHELQAYDEPLTWAHFKAEGDVEFKSVVFVPTNPPLNFYDKYYEKDAQSSLKLYVRRVFISDSIAELLPRCGDCSAGRGAVGQCGPRYDCRCQAQEWNSV